MQLLSEGTPLLVQPYFLKKKNNIGDNDGDDDEDDDDDDYDDNDGNENLNCSSLCCRKRS